MPAQDRVHLACEGHGVVEVAQPHVAAEHDAGGAALHVEADLAQDRLVVVLLDAPREQDEHLARRAHDAAQTLGRRLPQRAVGLGAVLIVRGIVLIENAIDKKITSASVAKRIL